jgi:hypothetical protein
VPDRGEDARMQRALALAIAGLGLVAPRVADACIDVAFEQHSLDRSQLDDTVKPGPVDVSMWIEGPDGGGCEAPSVQRRCDSPSGRELVVMVSATDDRTPPDKLGYRVTVTAGKAPFAAPGDVRPIQGQLFFALPDDGDLDFELAIRAIDLNGNIGPATYTQVTDAASSSGGCAAHRGRAVSIGMLAIAIASITRRRRSIRDPKARR